ncbi:MAG: DUF3810 family protein [Christensenellales bacterium]
MHERDKQTILLLRLTAILLSLILICLIFVLLATDRNIAEAITTTWGRLFSDGLGRLVSYLPFSLFEWCCFFVVAALVAILTTCIVLLCKKKYFKAGRLFLSTAVAAMVIANVYVSTATVAYSRKSPPLPDVDNSLITSSMVADSAQNFDNRFYQVSQKISVDDTGASVCPYDFDQLSDIISRQFDRLDKNYFGSGGKSVKAAAFSGIMSQTHIVGITFMPFGEATVNKYAPYTDIAFAMAHELAHTTGVMRESDANLVAVYVLITSDDDYLQYCGYLNAYYYFNLALIFSNNSNLVSARSLPAVAQADAQRKREFWSQYTAFDSIGDFFNDLYLKLNGQSGSDSYYQDNNADIVGKDENNNAIYDNVTYTDMQRMLIAMFC